MSQMNSMLTSLNEERKILIKCFSQSTRSRRSSPSRIISITDNNSHNKVDLSLLDTLTSLDIDDNSGNFNNNISDDQSTLTQAQVNNQQNELDNNSIPPISEITNNSEIVSQLLTDFDPSLNNFSSFNSAVQRATTSSGTSNFGSAASSAIDGNFDTIYELPAENCFTCHICKTSVDSNIVTFSSFEKHVSECDANKLVCFYCLVQFEKNELEAYQAHVQDHLAEKPEIVRTNSANDGDDETTLTSEIIDHFNPKPRQRLNGQLDF
jgi:hypothetical protein